MKPLVKWAGGKRQLLPEIHSRIPKYSTYYEPFLGGGAVLWSLAPQRATVGDLNGELINLYQVVRDQVLDLIAELSTYTNDAEFFYTLRALDRDDLVFAQLSDVQRAARTIYLNKTCYNGLYRVNKAGQFNAPFGRYKHPTICDTPALMSVHNYLTTNQVQFVHGSFAATTQAATAGDFIYFDPPYDPLNLTSNFTGYAANTFGRDEQIQLKELCDDLHERGVKFLVSNSATNFIKELYADYTIDIVSATRTINSIATRRGKVDEVLVRNYSVTT
ncbi:MAG: DNA adenine methylase [Corynebacterium sp.]|nr:DNA adenine methylase [Corynebacterium sp.]